MKVLRWLIALVSLAMVIGITQWESQRLTSPGDLHPSHAEVVELRGGDGCMGCHGSAGSMDDRKARLTAACNDCHVHITDQIERGRGFHGRLDRETAAACARCHQEHHGAAFVELSFQAAGFADPEEYDHRDIPGFDLTGRHGTLACAACHTLADAAKLEQGQRRFIGLEQACNPCHEDPHEGRLGVDCASCHGQSEPFEQVAEFVHDESFPLVGGHADVACLDCHDDIDTRRSGIHASRATHRRCTDCHRSPHRRAFVRGVADMTGTAPDATCTTCHEVEHATFLGPAAGMPADLHAATGFPLDPPHDGQTCDQCHAQYGRRQPLADAPSIEKDFAALFPGRSPGDCRACHGDPHQGQFDQGFTGGRCLECHESSHFAPSDFDVATHARTRFALTGAHQAVACEDCHAAANGVRRFVPTPTACAECHDDVHGGHFDCPECPEVTGDGRRGCMRCHDTSSFTAVHWSSATHEAWSGYRLNSGHATVACMGCHQRRKRFIGWVLDSPSPDCASCHVDPHAGQFADRGRTDCARCHGETETFAETHFDHQQDSRFPLDEHHRTLACADCHKAVRVPGFAPVVRYRPLGTQCQDCHDSRRLGAPGG